MKLSFSTLGCPEWTWAEILAVARDLGFDGIEIRGIMREMFPPRIKIFSDSNIEKTKNELTGSNLCIPILTSGAYMSDPSQIPLAEFEILAYAQLAQKLGVKYVRIMGENTPGPLTECDIEDLAAEYDKICEMIEPMGVTPLIETNGILASSLKMSQFMQLIKSKNCGVLWDINHTVRYFDETPEFTLRNIGKYIKHVHVKDSVKADGKIKYMLTGYGDLPIKDAVNRLNDMGYDGYFSYEWVKRWVPELEGSGIAFHTYASYMRSI
ncbi:MAG: sugar phosphate isomerase/epimerase [Clostridia bacterium]|nr:sugar phosphate isomerase/epimerase [Clostridia bacterium]